jgi:hypothetical protein
MPDEPDTEDDLVRRWVENWRQAGPKLEAIRRKELREFRYEDHAEEIDALLEIGLRFGEPRTTSGFVEQQRWFRKLRP